MAISFFYLVVELKINYTKIFFIATMLFFVVLFLVFLMSMLFVNTSVYPYKKKQQYMNDFFNDAMHELKTPLGVIHINLELMARYVSETKHIHTATERYMALLPDGGGNTSIRQPFVRILLIGQINEAHYLCGECSRRYC